MANGAVLKCTNFFGFPHSTVKKSQNYVRMALKSKSENDVQKILEQMTGLLDKKLMDYRRQSMVLGINIFSNETDELQNAARENICELEKNLNYPIPKELDPTLFAHYLLEVKRLNATPDTNNKYVFNIKKAIEFRKSIFDEQRFNLGEPRFSNAKCMLESLDETGRKIEEITQKINRVATYAETKKYNHHIPLSIEQKFLNSLKPHSYC